MTIMTRSAFEKRCEDFVQSALRLVDYVLAQANISSDQVQNLVMIGGSAYIRCFMNAIEGMFPAAASGRTKYLDPYLVVVHRTIILADRMSSAVSAAPRMKRKSATK